MRRAFAIVLAMLAVLFAGQALVFGQDTERSRFVKWVEEQISSPSYQIRLNGLEGTLSSDVRLESITIADDDGIWLLIEKPRMVWTRSALLTGRLVVNSLEAERVVLERTPKEEDGLPSPESSSYSLPDLPVAVSMEKLDLPLIEVGEQVFDLPLKAGMNGSLALDDGALDTDLAAERLDGAGGSLKAVTKYSRSEANVLLDILLSEPQDGVLATALGIKGKPPVSISLKGDAPISDLLVELGFDVDQENVLSGTLKFEDFGQDLKAALNVRGTLERIAPAELHPFFGMESALTADLNFPSAGGTIIERSSLESGVISMSANGATTPDGFLRRLNLDLDIGSENGERTVVPSEGNELSFARAKAAVAYDAGQNENWSASLIVSDAKNGEVTADEISLGADGALTGIDRQDARSLSFVSRGNISNISASDPKVAKAIGKSLTHNGEGRWSSSEPLLIDRFVIAGETMNASLKGNIEEFTFAGALNLVAENLEAFSAIAENSLKGSASLQASGTISPLTGGFDLDFDGDLKGFGLGNERLDPLLTPNTKLSGRATRNQDGLSFDSLKLANSEFTANVEGRLTSSSANLTATANVRDMKTVDETSSGAANLEMKLSGSSVPFLVEASVRMPEGKLIGQAVEALSIGFNGQTSGSDLKGNLSSAGTIASQRISVLGGLDANTETIDLDALLVTLGPTELRGYVSRKSSGLVSAEVEIDSKDIASAAALMLTKATGGISGRVELVAGTDNKQAAKFELKANDLVFEDVRIGKAQVSGDGTDLFGEPRLNAVVDAAAIRTSGISVRSVNGRIENAGTRSDFDLAAILDTNDARVRAVGEIEPRGAETRILFNQLQVNSDLANAGITSPTALVMRNGSVFLDNTLITVDGGRVTIDGQAGEKLALSAALTDVPLDIINAFQPGLDASGKISGTLNASGTSQNPSVIFQIAGSGITARDIKESGLEPLQVSTNGSFASGRIKLDRFSLANAQSLNLSGSGVIPLEEGGLSANINGDTPFAIIEPLLADRATQVEGIARVAIIAQGTLQAPVFSGGIQVNNSEITDPLSNLKLTGVNLGIEFVGSQNASLRVQGNLASGGSISANGSLGLAGGLPADINIVLSSARYTDGETFNTTLEGTLVLRGELLASPVLSGNVNLLRTEINVPETFAADAVLLDVTHENPSAQTRTTLERIEQVTPKQSTSSSQGTLRLDVNVSAPNQIFVRGRGLDAELGGQVHLTGTIANVIPVGAFTLRRGRLSILGQRLDLQEGSVTLAGNLDPVLDFMASTVSGDTEAFIRLQGPASALNVSFSSNPELPEDEVLAQIVFGRSVTELSPIQIARLASVALELTGGSSPSLVDGLRESTGLDDIDVVQDDDGNAAVKAGKYISDNVYLGVEAGQDTEATINLDITNNLKARGAVNSEGESSLGIFFEKDY